MSEWSHLSDFAIHIFEDEKCCIIPMSRFCMAIASPIFRIAFCPEKKHETKCQQTTESKCSHTHCISVQPCQYYSRQTMECYFNLWWRYVECLEIYPCEFCFDEQLTFQNVSEWIYLIQQYETLWMMDSVRNFLQNVNVNLWIEDLVTFQKVIFALDTFEEKNVIQYIAAYVARTYWTMSPSELQKYPESFKKSMLVWEYMGTSGEPRLVKILCQRADNVFIRYLNSDEKQNEWISFSVLAIPKMNYYVAAAGATDEYNFYCNQLRESSSVTQ